MKHLIAVASIAWVSAKPGVVQAETPFTKADSIQNVLARPIADTVRVKTLVELAGEHYLSSPDLAIQDCKAALELAEKISFDEGIGESLGWLAYLYEQLGNNELALTYYQRSYAFAVKTKSRKSEATILNNIAAIYNNLGQTSDALRYHDRAIAISEFLNDSDGLATSFNNVALIYQGQGRIPEALDYYTRSLKIYDRLHDKDGQATALANIGFIYREQKEFGNAAGYFFLCLAVATSDKNKYNTGYALNALGGVYEEQNKNDSALYYFNQSLKVRLEIGDQQGMAYTLKNIGNVYSKTGRKAEAQGAFRKSLDLFEKLQDKRGLSAVTNLYGAALLDEQRFAESESYLNRSLALARELGYPGEIRNAAGSLQRLYRVKKRWQDALLMNDVYIQMRDSVENDVNRKVAMKAQAGYEYEKKEAMLRMEQQKESELANAEIRKQKIIRNSVTGGLAGVAIFLVIVFRQRNRILLEKKRSDALLLNILPAETAEELKHTGSAKAKSFDQVTVLFTDFKNFTQTSERLTPEELVSEINACYSAFDRIVERHNVEKIKTIGDAYMCAGGLPVPNTSHPEDVVRAGLEMQQFMTENNSRRKSAGLPAFELRVGIHTGPVVAGIVGIKKFAYDIWGDTVNTASRMESSGEIGKVNISGATYELVKDRFQCIHRGRVTAKNKGEIDMYFVSRSLSAG